MKSKKHEVRKLHFTERNLLTLIREMRAGELIVKTQDGLPMVAEIHDKKKIILNRETADE